MDTNEEVAYFMFAFKVNPCTKAFPHSWATCPCHHEGEKARRRDPRAVPYSPVLCPHAKEGRADNCPCGDRCVYSHNVFEAGFHPKRFRTLLCTMGKACTRTTCFYAHSESELRARVAPALLTSGLKNGAARPPSVAYLPPQAAGATVGKSSAGLPVLQGAMPTSLPGVRGGGTALTVANNAAPFQPPNTGHRPLGDTSASAAAAMGEGSSFLTAGLGACSFGLAYPDMAPVLPPEPPALIPTELQQLCQEMSKVDLAMGVCSMPFPQDALPRVHPSQHPVPAQLWMQARSLPSADTPASSQLIDALSDAQLASAVRSWLKLPPASAPLHPAANMIPTHGLGPGAPWEQPLAAAATLPFAPQTPKPAALCPADIPTIGTFSGELQLHFFQLQQQEALVRSQQLEYARLLGTAAGVAQGGLSEGSILAFLQARCGFPDTSLCAPHTPAALQGHHRSLAVMPPLLVGSGYM